jgi:hypothetical protein
MKTLFELLNDAVYVADKAAYKGKIYLSPAFFDIDEYDEEEKHTGNIICSGRFGGYDLQMDPSLQGYGIAFNNDNVTKCNSTRIISK